MTAALVGLEGRPVEVQVDIAHQGLPNFLIVGLPGGAVREARERVRTAIKNSGFNFPLRRITVNLAPAELPKSGPTYDLPLALAILVASGQVEPPPRSMLIGELSLDGQLRHTPGILPMAALARQLGLERLYVPAADAAEAALVDGLTVLGLSSLGELVSSLRGDLRLDPAAPRPLQPQPASAEDLVDLAEVRGQEHAKRCLEIAAAGGHNLLMTGPPGAGKTLLARAMPAILPPMTPDEMLEVTRIYSVAGLLSADAPAIHQRPFRAPHHTISYAGLVGGGIGPRPGEVSLAHRGVLFLDELPEFHPRVLEVLRQPVEDGVVGIARANATLIFPARFMLVAARNPCPCGYFGDAVRPCVCPPALVTRYQKRLSGPILDRIDLHLSVPRVDFEKLADGGLGESSASIRARVVAARQRQWRRYAELPGVSSNAEMRLAEIRRWCTLEPGAAALLRSAVEHLGLSARGYHRVLRLARTIADLADADQLQPPHVAEAITYQPRSERA